MKRILIDTNIYSRAMRGDAGPVEVLRRAEAVLISPVVVGELMNGFERGTRTAANRQQLDDFLSRRRIELLSITRETSGHYSAILSGLQTKGTPIPTNDIWIAQNTPDCLRMEYVEKTVEAILAMI